MVQLRTGVIFSKLFLKVPLINIDQGLTHEVEFKACVNYIQYDLNRNISASVLIKRATGA